MCSSSIGSRGSCSSRRKPCNSATCIGLLTGYFLKLPILPPKVHDAITPAQPNGCDTACDAVSLLPTAWLELRSWPAAL